ncbi:OsmC family protein [Hansschlegelia sp. KR7-227]|uniref:OsmC family protein n=1 Tax=Hansschlegelia sp. KR7-227 TaxID=3400914 RepID=UPI003C018F7A
MSSAPVIRIKQLDGYRFVVDFGPELPGLLVDEAPPVGGGEGPFPEQLLVAAVANCLCASMVFALGKFKQDAGDVAAEADCVLGRNEEGRLRIQGIDVAITLGADAGDMDRIDRVLEQFERFCTVSESVKTGVPVSVRVSDGKGLRLK